MSAIPPPGDQWFAWAITGESYHPNSSSPWKCEHHTGEIYAECAGEALEKIVTCLGEGATLASTIPWDLIEQGREITLTIKPIDHAERRRAAEEAVRRHRERTDA